jgi:hypothetical protein
MDLERLVTDVETEGGAIRGIDLGSIYSDERAVDASEYRVGLASIAEACGWRERCHAMVSGGSWARRHYIAEPIVFCSSCKERIAGPCCDLCGDCRNAEAMLGRDCCDAAQDG